VAVLLFHISASQAVGATQGVRESTSAGGCVSEYAVPTLNSGPLAITTDKGGVVWFTESNSSKIGRFDPDSGEFEEFPLPNGTGDMWGITVSNNGLVWFTQYGVSSASTYASGGFLPGGQGVLWSFDPSDQEFRSFDLPKKGTLPLRVAEDLTGRIWFTELLGDSLGMFDPASERFSEFHTPTANSGPAGLAVDLRGLIWFTESTSRSIAVFNPNNSTFREFRFQELFAPVGISIDQSERVWVADHGVSRVGVFDPRNGILRTYPTSDPSTGIHPYSLPNDIAIDEKGGVWFTEHAGNRIGRLDPTQNSLIEYEIPSGPISSALWLATSPSGDVWFAEYSANQIGLVNASQPIPITLSSDQDSTVIQAGSQATVRVTLGGTSTLLRLFSASTSTPEELSVSFSENPVLIDPVKDPSPIIAVDVLASSESASGQYAMLVGATNGQVSLSTFLLVTVTKPSNLPNWEAYSLAGLAGLIAILILTVRWKKRRAVRRAPSRSFRSFMDDHKIAVMILGVASTNFVGAIAGLIHLLILQAPTRVVPLSNVTLAEYGYYAFWLDVTELILGVMTVYALLLAWKPNRRIRAGILLTVVLIASTLVVVSILPGARPVQCDIVIRNSLFYGSYSPSSFQTTIHDTVTVTWCVDSNSVHADTVTSDTGLFNSGPIAQGSSWSYTFDEPGTYEYHSIAHFWMHGTVNVTSQERATPTAYYQAVGDFASNGVRLFEPRSGNAVLDAGIARLAERGRNSNSRSMFADRCSWGGGVFCASFDYDPARGSNSHSH